MPEHTSRTIFSNEEIKTALRSIEAKVGRSGADSVIYHLQSYALTLDSTEFFTIAQVERYLKTIFGEGSSLIMPDVRHALLDQTRTTKNIAS